MILYEDPFLPIVEHHIVPISYCIDPDEVNSDDDIMCHLKELKFERQSS